MGKCSGEESGGDDGSDWRAVPLQSFASSDKWVRGVVLESEAFAGELFARERGTKGAPLHIRGCRAKKGTNEFNSRHIPPRQFNSPTRNASRDAGVSV